MQTSVPNAKLDKLPKEITHTAWALVIGALPPMLDSTMVNIAINKLQNSLHTNLNMIQWAITGYVLALAVAVPICGYMVNHFNGKRVLQWSIASFGIASLLAGLAWNIETFILFRALQGFAAGFIILLMTTLLMNVAPAGRFGELIAIISTPIIIGPIVGPIIGGFLVQNTNWHWLFYINIPVCLIAIILNIFFLRDFSPMNPNDKLDWFGTLLLITGSIGLIFGIIKGSENTSNFFNQHMLIACGIGLAAFIVYAVWNSLRHSQTVLPLRFFKAKNYTAANIGIFLSGIAANGPMLLLPLYFQNTLGFTATQAALMLIPQGIGMFIARPTLGKLIDRIGARPVVLVSILISLLGSIPFIFVTADSNLYWLGMILFIRGLGIGGLQMPMMTDIFVGLAKQDIAAASVGQRIIQNIGASFGSAIIAAVVTSVVTNQLPGQLTNKLNQLANQNVKLTPTIMANTKETALQVVTLHGYQVGFLLSAIVLVIIVLPSLFLSDVKTTK